MNCIFMNLAAAKEVYLNCYGTIIPIRIEKIIKKQFEDSQLICSVPSTIDIPYHECYQTQAEYMAHIASSVRRRSDLAIKDVIFNPPATIVFWTDGTKIIVKVGEHDIYDPEKGLAMAITKKALGNEGNYYNVIRRWLKPYEEQRESIKRLTNFIHDFFSKPIGTVKSVRETEDGLFAEIDLKQKDVDWVE